MLYHACAHDITHLFLDEIHKYGNWAQELKNIYDGYPKLHVVVTGSNALDIIHQMYDLSRRCRVYTMQGMSFREYLKMENVADLPVVSLEELVNHHLEISRDITIKQNVKVLLHFDISRSFFCFSIMSFCSAIVVFNLEISSNP